MASDGRDGCAWCRSTAASPAWPGREPPDFQIRRCRTCGHHFTVPVLSHDEMAGFYRETYYGETNRRFNALLEFCIGWFRRSRAARLARFTRPGKVLDIGCGRGLTLAALRNAGWTPRGCELSATASRYAREVLNLDVASDGFVAERYATGEFDAVILWHVFEHLDDPRRVIEQLARIVKPGGVLALAVPNIESYQAAWSRYGWFHLDLPRHYSHFGASWLREKLGEHGFRVVAESHASLEQNPYGWIQSMLNRWGLRHNLLYDILRRRSARATPDPWRTYPVQSLCSVIGLVVLLPFSLVMLVAEAGGRRGATVDLYAIREGNTTVVERVAEAEALPSAVVPARA